MKNKKKVLFSVLVGFFLVTSLTCLLYPTVSNYINELNNESKIVSYGTEINSFTDQEKEAYLAAAEEYNENLALRTVTSNDMLSSYEYDDTDYYKSILNFDNEQIGAVEIPKINVNLPIYHGTGEDVLSYGAAHLPGTSFPIGGESTHSVISAHTAYPTQKFFDDIDKLKVGDTFYIGVLDKKLVYRVSEINIVEPEDTSKLQVVDGEDLVTLVTCYPYAVNTHRLLVTGKRGEESNTTSSIDEIATKTNNTTPYTIYIVIIGAVLIAGITFVIIKKRGKNK